MRKKLKERELIKVIGYRDYIIIRFLSILELLINLPYKMLRFIVTDISIIFIVICEEIFYKERFFTFLKFKRISNYYYKLKERIKEYKRGNERNE